MNYLEKTKLDIEKYFEGVEYQWDFYKEVCNSKKEGGCHETKEWEGNDEDSDNLSFIKWKEETYASILERFILTIIYQKKRQFPEMWYEFCDDHFNYLKNILSLRDIKLSYKKIAFTRSTKVAFATDSQNPYGFQASIKAVEEVEEHGDTRVKVFVIKLNGVLTVVHMDEVDLKEEVPLQWNGITEEWEEYED